MQCKYLITCFRFACALHRLFTLIFANHLIHPIADVNQFPRELKKKEKKIIFGEMGRERPHFEFGTDGFLSP